MIDTLEGLRDAARAGQGFRYVFFWSHRPEADGRLTAACLSQWWPCAFTLDGVAYASSKPRTARPSFFTIAGSCVARIAAMVKKLGRAVRGFDEARWRSTCFDLVTRGNVAKFSQDPALGEFLLGTGDAVLAEASPTDRVWGIGLAAVDERAADPLRWEGENLLGFALMRARQALRSGSASG
jgi:ribA/ribD-fused uncharacterized protein